MGHTDETDGLCPTGLSQLEPELAEAKVSNYDFSFPLSHHTTQRHPALDEAA
jgi:hypothetical protein